MFGFSKKKNNDELAQPPNAPASTNQAQSTIVEDDAASFEVPDFSDDDLNFDLGLGEFMPEGNNLPPAPKGLPTEPAEQKGSQQTQQMQHIQMPNQPNQETDSSSPPEAPPVMQDENNDEYAKKEDAVRDAINEPAKAQAELPEFDVENTATNTTEQFKEENYSEAPEDIPKFEIKQAIDIYDAASTENIKKKEVTSPNNRESVHKNKSAVKKEEKKREEAKHYVQVSAGDRDIFVPIEVYKKIVILTEDIAKKTSCCENVKKNYVSLIKTEKEMMIEADKDSKSIRDLIMSADAKLFGEG